jgi:hypothetical protein
MGGRNEPVLKLMVGRSDKHFMAPTNSLSKRMTVLDLQDVRKALARCDREGSDPATLVVRLLRDQQAKSVELLDAYADALLASGVSPLAVCAVRDAADVLAGKLPFPLVHVGVALRVESRRAFLDRPRAQHAT